MVTIKSAPWHVEGKVLLLGDAAHAIVPFFGQGMNCAFEDCTVFLELLDRLGPDWPLLFQEFERARKINTDAIADLALENFVEMRDRVADPRFLFRKKAELALEAKYPRHFVPKYAMVTFHRVPYSVALSRGKIQDRLLADIAGLGLPVLAVASAAADRQSYLMRPDQGRRLMPGAEATLAAHAGMYDVAF